MNRSTTLRRRIPDLLYTPEYTAALFRADRVFCADHFVGGRWDDAGARGSPMRSSHVSSARTDWAFDPIGRWTTPW